MGNCIRGKEENTKEHIDALSQRFSEIDEKIDWLNIELQNRIRDNDLLNVRKEKNETKKNEESEIYENLKTKNTNAYITSTALIKASNNIQNDKYLSLTRGVPINNLNITIQQEVCKYKISSDSEQDSNDNIGAHKLLIIGIDKDWNDQKEIVTLNGKSPIITKLSFRGLNEIIVIEAGQKNYNIGNISITTEDDIINENGHPTNILYGCIKKYWSNSNLGFHFVPKGCYYIPISYIVNTEANIDDQIKIQVFVEPFGLPRQQVAEQSFANLASYELQAMPNIEEKSIIYLNGKKKEESNTINNLTVWFQFAKVKNL